MTTDQSNPNTTQFRYWAEPTGYSAPNSPAYCLLRCVADRHLPSATRHLVREALREALCAREDISVRGDDVASYTSTSGNTVFVASAHYDTPLYVDEVVTAMAGLETYEQVASTVCEVGQTAVEQAMASVPA